MFMNLSLQISCDSCKSHVFSWLFHGMLAIIKSPVMMMRSVHWAKPCNFTLHVCDSLSYLTTLLLPPTDISISFTLPHPAAEKSSNQGPEAEESCVWRGWDSTKTIIIAVSRLSTFTSRSNPANQWCKESRSAPLPQRVNPPCTRLELTWYNRLAWPCLADYQYQYQYRLSKPRIDWNPGI